MKIQESKEKVIIWFLSALSGYLCVAIPPFIKGETNSTSDSPIFPFISFAIDHLRMIPTVVLLICFGLLAGFVRPKYWLFIGVCSLSIFPIASLIEGIIYPGTHNLFPFEILLYIILCIPTLIGTFIGKYISQRVNRK